MPKPRVAELKAVCPDVDERLVLEHLARLDDRYFATFDESVIGAHVRALSLLSVDCPVRVLCAYGEENRTDCTILAFDYPGEFSLLSGILAGLGFSIVSGDVFTYSEVAAPPASSARPRGRRRQARPPDSSLRRRRIIDRFSGTLLRVPSSAREWEQTLRARVGEVIGLLESGRLESVTAAKHRVNEMVAARLSELRTDSLPVLYPVELTVDNERGPFTTLRVVAQDTPAFLYALSTALALQGIRIEHVAIRTVENRIEDEIDVLDARGRKIDKPAALNRIKLAVLLTKQFTYFLPGAPDPYAALCRFEQLVEKVLELPDRGEWLTLLSSPTALRDLARLLGASDYIWEDFIRLQYEALLPMLQPELNGRRFSKSAADLRAELEEQLAGLDTLEAKTNALNEFKDRQTFLIDLDHILAPDADVRALAEPLTAVAELVVQTAVRLAYQALAARFGTPRTVAGLEAAFAVFGLGKLGGVALGYASDIELLFVYSDSGQTDGKQAISNSEFFEQLAQDTAGLIRAKREGIFHVDLQLRPFSKAGPLAASLESFCKYYGPGGGAHAYERLALVRLRAIAGDPELGAQIERLRDEFVYGSESISVTELRELRERQFEQKRQAGRANAKFDPGALVDLEYDVQLLQVMHGKERPELRTPRLHEALAALAGIGVLGAVETRQLTDAYFFLRRLINALRMLRGSAKDLFLPDAGADEFLHLARRMGYRSGGELSPEQALRVDFETQTARVRAFVERHFGRDALPGEARGNVADLILSEALDREAQTQILREAGFRHAGRALVNLRGLAGAGARRDAFAGLAVLACDMLRRMPDPDMALNNWERFAQAVGRADRHFEMLLAKPKRLEILLSILAGSQFLADTLVKNPEFFEWATDPVNVRAERDRDVIIADLRVFVGALADEADWRNALRRFRRREILRIGTRDMCLKLPVETITADLSALAESITQVTLEHVWRKQGLSAETDTARALCVLALGKLGGRELNYSSDIDLVGFYGTGPANTEDGAGRTAAERHAETLAELRRCLSEHTAEGYVYRVDLRLRPYGRAGRLVQSAAELVEYYHTKASPWEVQALIKARPIAGNLALGRRFLGQARAALFVKRSRPDVVRAMQRLRARAHKEHARHVRPGEIDVKQGLGGIRDIEFLIQALQLEHAVDCPELMDANTLAALEKAGRLGILPQSQARELRADYVFLRRVEHCLQLLEDRQTHAVPAAEPEQTALAKRVLRVDACAADLMDALNAARARVRHAFEQLVREPETT